MKVRDVGKFIREQRNAVGMSLRKLAEAAGVSNPYLSQIERGLRRPSAEILSGIAKALRISAGRGGLDPGGPVHHGAAEAGAGADLRELP